MLVPDFLDVWMRLPRHKWPKSCPNIEESIGWELVDLDEPTLNRTMTFSINISNHGFLLPQQKNYKVGETSGKNCRVVIRHGMTCEKVRREVSRTDRQKDSNCSQCQRFAWMITTSRCMFSNCPEMLVFGTHWWTRRFLVCKQTGSSSHKMDKSL